MEEKIAKLVAAANSTNATAKETGTKMLLDLGLDTNGDPIKKKEEKPKREPKPKAPKKSAAPSYDCDDLIAKERERKAKAKEAAEKRANAPKKTPATKNKESIEKTTKKVEKSVATRAKKGEVSVAEIDKLIAGYEEAIKKLKELRERASGKMAKGGSLGSEELSDIISQANSVHKHHCKCQDKAEKKKPFEVDDVVYNKKENTVGIVRIAEERGEVKTDADGNVDADFLEYYNPMKHESHKRAKVAPSTKAEIDKRGLWKPFVKMAKGGYVEVVSNNGNGKIINKLYNQWNNAKTQKQYDQWLDAVRKTKFGTYGTVTFENVLENFDFDKAPINSFHLKTFKAELKAALNGQGKMAKGGGFDQNGNPYGFEDDGNDGGMLYFVQNELPSGTIANMSSVSDYKTIDAIRSMMVKMLQENGDEGYSISALKKLVKDAEVAVIGKTNKGASSVGSTYYKKGGGIRKEKVSFKYVDENLIIAADLYSELSKKEKVILMKKYIPLRIWEPLYDTMIDNLASKELYDVPYQWGIPIANELLDEEKNKDGRFAKKIKRIEDSAGKKTDTKMAKGGKILSSKEYDEESYPSHRQYLISYLTELFGKQNSRSSSADWGGIPVWTLKGDGIEGTFIGIGDEDDLFIVTRKEDVEQGETIEEEIMRVTTFDQADTKKMNDLIAKAKSLQGKMKTGGGTSNGRSIDKIEKVMREFKEGKLLSSNGKTVTKRKQAIAIALTEAGISKKKARGGNLINKKYAYFAVAKSDNKIVDAWEIVDDVDSLKYYAKLDLESNDLNPKDYKILSKKFLISQGINPFDVQNWKNH